MWVDSQIRQTPSLWRPFQRQPIRPQLTNRLTERINLPLSFCKGKRSRSRALLARVQSSNWKRTTSDQSRLHTIQSWREIRVGQCRGRRIGRSRASLEEGPNLPLDPYTNCRRPLEHLEDARTQKIEFTWRHAWEIKMWAPTSRKVQPRNYWKDAILALESQRRAWWRCKTTPRTSPQSKCRKIGTPQPSNCSMVHLPKSSKTTTRRLQERAKLASKTDLEALHRGSKLKVNLHSNAIKATYRWILQNRASERCHIRSWQPRAWLMHPFKKEDIAPGRAPVRNN